MPKVKTNPHPVGTDEWKEWNTDYWVIERWKKAHPPPKKKSYYVRRPPRPPKPPKPPIEPKPTWKELVRKSRDLWNAAVDRLKEYGIHSWVLRNRAMVEQTDAIRGQAKKQYRYAGVSGAADVTGVLPDGRRLDVCCPLRREPRDDQKSFLRKINESGGVAFAIYSIAELDEQITKLGYEMREKDRDEDEKEVSIEEGECRPSTPEVPVGSASGSGEQPPQDAQCVPF